MHDEPPRPPEATALPTPPADSPRKILSSDLFASGAREIVIEHGDRLYRMRITQNGKLILTA